MGRWPSPFPFEEKELNSKRKITIERDGHIKSSLFTVIIWGMGKWAHPLSSSSFKGLGDAYHGSYYSSSREY